MEKITTEKVPEYLLPYIFNGDATGLTDEEIEQWDEWERKNLPEGYIPFCVDEDNYNPYFTSRPVVGLPTTVIDVDFYKG